MGGSNAEGRPGWDGWECNAGVVRRDDEGMSWTLFAARSAYRGATSDPAGGAAVIVVGVCMVGAILSPPYLVAHYVFGVQGTWQPWVAGYAGLVVLVLVGMMLFGGAGRDRGEQAGTPDAEIAADVADRIRRLNVAPAAPARRRGGWILEADVQAAAQAAARSEADAQEAALAGARAAAYRRLRATIESGRRAG